MRPSTTNTLSPMSQARAERFSKQEAMRDAQPLQILLVVRFDCFLFVLAVRFELLLLILLLSS